jgi:protein required for attachment to host cells
MDNVWILVASRSGAQLFRHHGGYLGYRRGLELVRAIEHPEGRLKNHEIDSDAPGRVFSTGGGRSIKHGMLSQVHSDEHLTIAFAKQLAEILDQENSKQSFRALVLVAGSPMLGLLRQSLSKATTEKVVSTVGRNLQNFERRDIQLHLADTLRQLDRDQGLRGMA